ncbi:DUF4397 domain-containing protein [Tolypothrix campylonemoides VB511288]|nr:DUF4397 domain-containing protein [Tolypothrix campylonemoides VB511288]
MLFARQLLLSTLSLLLIGSTSFPQKSLANSQQSAEPSQILSTQGQLKRSKRPNQFVCPVKLRVINAAIETGSAVDVIINGQKQLENVPFRQASQYVDLPPGSINVNFVQAGTNNQLAYRTFTGAPNGAYTVAITGPIQGPPGQPLFNESPFVIQEDLTQPNPGKFKGRWYRFSETNAVIDFRISKSSSPNQDETRLTDLIPKTAIAYPELTAGRYNFNPVLPDQFDPLVNDAFNPPIQVEVVNQDVPAGVIFDVIATGNPLGQGPNSLTLTTASTQVAPPDANGCNQIVE